MPEINEPTMHEMLWEWFDVRGYQVSAEVSVGNGRIDLVACDSKADEYIGVELKDQAKETDESTIPSSLKGTRWDNLQSREDFEWDKYWSQLHRYQTSGYLDRLYFASQRPHSIFEVLDKSPETQTAIDRAESVDEMYQGTSADREEIGAIRVPGPQGGETIEIVREGRELPREKTPSMSRTDEQWVQHYIWKHLGGIREGVLPNRSNATFRRIDVAAFTGPHDPSKVYEQQPECDIIGVEAKGNGVVRRDTAAIEQQLVDYIDSGALTKLYLAVPEGDRSDAVTMLTDTKSDNQQHLDEVGLYSVNKSGTVKEVVEAERVTLRYDGIHTKEGNVTDIIWGYGGDWTQDKQYYSLFDMKGSYRTE